jgi:hypothetical protein
MRNEAQSVSRDWKRGRIERELLSEKRVYTASFTIQSLLLRVEMY